MSSSNQRRGPPPESAKSSTGSLLSPKKAARVLGVSESSVKRWCDAGHLSVVKTTGGHRKISLSTLIAFARNSDQSIQNPQLIDIPNLHVRAADAADERLLPQLTAHLGTGNEESARSILVSSWMAGQPLSYIFDTLVGPAFGAIGHQWESNELEIYEERRACLIAERCFSDLRRLVGPPSSNAPIAIGCTLEGDPYSLPTAMCELTLRELGWNAENLGTWQPIESIVLAIKNIRPRIFWLSVSRIGDIDAFAEKMRTLNTVIEEHHCALVIGGRALGDPTIRKSIEFTSYCDSMKQFTKIAEQIHSVPK